MTMNTGFERGSAKIYEFPTRGRLIAGGHREETKTVADQKPTRIAEEVFGGSWYHDVAVRDAERDRKS